MFGDLLYLNIIGWFLIGFLCGGAVGLFTLVYKGPNPMIIACLPLGMVGAVAGAVLLNVITGAAMMHVTLQSIIAAIAFASLFAYIVNFITTANPRSA